MRKLGNIEIIYNVNDESINKEFIEQDKPVIIKGAIKNWPAHHKWDLLYLKQRIGDVLVKFKSAKSGLFPNPDLFYTKELPDIMQTKFADYINLLERNKQDVTIKDYFFLNADETYLFKNGVFNKQFNSIISDFIIPTFIPKKNLMESGLWISQKGTASSIHYDYQGCHNLNTQIKGSKRVVLFNPAEYTKLYMCPINGELLFSNFSKVNWQNINYNKFPNIKEVQYIEGVLEPGDAIFIPAFWLHYFDHIGDFNINVNFWWSPTKITFNSASLSWLLNVAAAHIFFQQKNNEFKKNSIPKKVLFFLKELEAIFIDLVKEPALENEQPVIVLDNFFKIRDLNK